MGASRGCELTAGHYGGPPFSSRLWAMAMACAICGEDQFDLDESGFCDLCVEQIEGGIPAVKAAI